MMKPRVLVVDDSAMNVELVSFVLGSDGFVVDEAVDASEAATRIGTSRPDLILMDIQLPGLDGVAFTRVLKADPHTRDIPIVAFTAYAMKGDEARLLEAGCDGYLSKPIDVATFATRVRSFLRTAVSTQPPRAPASPA
jgi:two-component system cell cycle response regulator DivK